MISRALQNIRPGAEWYIKGADVYENITWLRGDKPSKAEVIAEVERLEAEILATAYKKQRAKEYPPITDYLDAVVKNDAEQMQAYIDACLAVKSKYPKPE